MKKMLLVGILVAYFELGGSCCWADDGFYVIPTPYKVLPKGAIIMWNGQIDQEGHPIIDGKADKRWQVCDGTNGTPNLGDKFIKGTTVNNDPADKEGGSNSVKLTIENIPPHSHQAGDLSTTNAGEHQHEYGKAAYGASYTEVAGLGGEEVVKHLHYIGSPSFDTTSEGIHNHDISGSTGMTGGVEPLDIQPSYYKLIFLMYTGP